MSFCPNCGTQITEADQFCGECGCKIPDEQPCNTANPAHATVTNSNDIDPNSKAFKVGERIGSFAKDEMAIGQKKVPKLAIAGAGGLIAIIIAAVLLIGPLTVHETWYRTYSDNQDEYGRLDLKTDLIYRIDIDGTHWTVYGAAPNNLDEWDEFGWEGTVTKQGNSYSFIGDSAVFTFSGETLTEKEAFGGGTEDDRYDNHIILETYDRENGMKALLGGVWESSLDELDIIY